MVSSNSDSGRSGGVVGGASNHLGHILEYRLHHDTRPTPLRVKVHQHGHVELVHHVVERLVLPVGRHLLGGVLSEEKERRVSGSVAIGRTVSTTRRREIAEGGLHLGLGLNLGFRWGLPFGRRTWS